MALIGSRLSLTFYNQETDQEFALEDLEEGLIWGVLLFSVRWHDVKARASLVR